MDQGIEIAIKDRQHEEQADDEGNQKSDLNADFDKSAAEIKEHDLERGAVVHSQGDKKKENSKGELNQEDIDAVQFLAAEFSKESSSGKATEPKIQIDIETVDGDMIEVAAVQGVITNVPENIEPDTTVATLTDVIEDADQPLSLEVSQSTETQSKKRKIKSEDREFKCGYCVKSFSMKIALEKHLVTHGANLPWQCDNCSEGFMKSSDYKDHCNKVHANYRPFPCHVCGKRLSNLGILKNHQGIHSGERPFTCQFASCKKSFLTKTNLDDHERKHVNAREFECGTCQKRFNLKGDLRQHEKVHKEDKPFRCEFCDMAFPRGPSLWRHRRTHTGEKPYQCDICEKRFSRMENCQEHRRIHTGERPLVCTVCGKAFRDSGNFSNHKKIHQEGYVPRKKRGSGPRKTKEKQPIGIEETVEQTTQLPESERIVSGSQKGAGATSNADISQEVAFIVAPMPTDPSQEHIGMTVANSAAESSYVQVGNFLLTLEMEAAFKQMMQQQGGSNEFVTLTTADGKSLEFITDPSQAEALMQVAAQTNSSTTDLHLQDVQEVIKQNLSQPGTYKFQVEPRDGPKEENFENIAIVDKSEHDPDNTSETYVQSTEKGVDETVDTEAGC